MVRKNWPARRTTGGLMAPRRTPRTAQTQQPTPARKRPHESDSDSATESDAGSECSHSSTESQSCRKRATQPQQSDDKANVVLNLSGESINAHRSMLARQCDLFKSDTYFSRTVEIDGKRMFVIDASKILDVSSLSSFDNVDEAFKHMVEIWYSSHPLEVKPGLAEPLMIIADIFHCESVFKMTTKYFSKDIDMKQGIKNMDRALSVFLLSKKFVNINCDLLKQAKQLLVENFSDVLQQNRKIFKDFLYMEYEHKQELMAEINFKQEKVFRAILSILDNFLAIEHFDMDDNIIIKMYKAKSFIEYYDQCAKLSFAVKWLKKEFVGRKRTFVKLLEAVNLTDPAVIEYLSSLSDGDEIVWEVPECFQLVMKNLHRKNEDVPHHRDTPPKQLRSILIEEHLPLDVVQKHSWNRRDCSLGVMVLNDGLTAAFPDDIQSRTIRGEVVYTRGCHVWKVVWPVSDRGLYSRIGVSSHSAPLRAPIGDQGDSFAVSVVHCNKMMKVSGMQFDMYRRHSQPVEEFIMVLDCDEGTLGFCGVDGDYWGHAFTGLNHRALCVACSSNVMGNVSLKYR